MKHPKERFILASSSKYRAKLLGNLLDHFDCVDPSIDESIIENEQPHDRAMRLASAKATAVVEREPTAWVIGSDQVAELEGVPLRKPRNFDNACNQLLHCSGREVIFHTAVSLWNPKTGNYRTEIEQVRVNFRTLSEHEIETYLRLEEPYDCAGSFKSEGRGIALFSSLEIADPSALIGLPLIRLNQMLLDAGVNPLLLNQDKPDRSPTHQ